MYLIENKLNSLNARGSLQLRSFIRRSAGACCLAILICGGQPHLIRISRKRKNKFHN